MVSEEQLDDNHECKFDHYSDNVVSNDHQELESENTENLNQDVNSDPRGIRITDYDKIFSLKKSINDLKFIKNKFGSKFNSKTRRLRFPKYLYM